MTTEDQLGVTVPDAVAVMEWLAVALVVVAEVTTE